MTEFGDTIIHIGEEKLHLNAGAALYWESKKILVVADLHLGKTAHFRKHGIPVPITLLHDDLERLTSIIGQYQPETLLVCGDMFHQDFNNDIDLFMNWRNGFDALEIILIKGNHDKFSVSLCNSLGIEVMQPHLDILPFRFVHKPPIPNAIGTDKNFITISGHLHPGVRLRGKARQWLRLPCFTLTSSALVLPAFSMFTGLQIGEAKDGCHYYAIADDKIMKV